jgi:diaminopimelate decarboxylase
MLRPPLYEAFHSIIEVVNNSIGKTAYDVVGPICETADFLGKDRKLSIAQGDFLAVENVGAYGFVLSSNYNTRPKIDEYIISNNKVKKIRKRDTINQILENEIDFL